MENAETKSDCKRLAQEHVDWLIGIIRPLLLTEFEHGFEHGVRAVKNKRGEITVSEVK